MAGATAGTVVPAVASIAGGGLASKGGKEAADSAGTASRNAENARLQAMQMLTNPLLAGALNTLLPGFADAMGLQLQGNGPWGAGSAGPSPGAGGKLGQIFPPMGNQQQPQQGGGEQPGQEALYGNAEEAQIGELIANAIRYQLENPGISPVAYERAQEQSNLGLNAGQRMAAGGLAGAGVNPDSQFGQQIGQGLINMNQFARQEANRDFTIADEQMRDQRTGAAIQNFLAALSPALNLMSGRASAAAGGAFPQVAPINPYQALASGLTTAGYGFAQGYDPYAYENDPDFVGPPTPRQ